MVRFTARRESRIRFLNASDQKDYVFKGPEILVVIAVGNVLDNALK